jgi:2-oxoglutarate ferredoxin oxidoreductase subunit alpha
VRGFPFAQGVYDFIAAHERVFVIEQNRDAQLKTLLMTEGGIDAAKLPSVLHYDGTPITARFIAGEIAQRLAPGRPSTGQSEAAE